MFRIIAFLVGLISVTVGLLNYDSTLATAPVPVVTGALVILIAAFNLLPKIRRCPFCDKKIPTKSKTCRYCGASLPPGN
jgi:hypothetical protein